MIDFLEKVKTITGNYYSKLLTALRGKSVERRLRELLKHALFSQDNVLGHKLHIA